MKVFFLFDDVTFLMNLHLYVLCYVILRGKIGNHDYYGNSLNNCFVRLIIYSGQLFVVSSDTFWL